MSYQSDGASVNQSIDHSDGAANNQAVDQSMMINHRESLHSLDLTEDDLSELLDDTFIDSLPVSPRSESIKQSIAQVEEITRRLSLQSINQSFNHSANQSLDGPVYNDDDDDDLDWARLAASAVSINNRGSTASTEGNSPINQSTNQFDEDKTEPPSPINRSYHQSNLAPFIPTAQSAVSDPIRQSSNQSINQSINQSRIQTLALIIDRHTQSNNRLSEELFDSCMALRKMLSLHDPSVNPAINRLPFDQVFQSGVLKSLVILFQPQSINQSINQTFNQSIIHLHTEIAWIFTNIASSSSDHVNQLIDSGVVPLLVQHIQSIKQSFDHPLSPAFKQSINQLMEQIVWALGNIAGDSVQCRDILLKERVIDRLIDYVNDCGLIPTNDQISQSINQSIHQSSTHSLTLLRQIAWTLRCLISHRPPPSNTQSIKQIVTCLPFIHHCLIDCLIDDTQIRPHLLWILPCITMLGPSIQQAMIERDFLPYLLQVISQSINQLASQSINQSISDPVSKQCQYECLISSIRCIGCFLTSNAELSQSVLDEGLIDCLPMLLIDQLNDEIVKEVCWMISNIAAGTKSQIQALIDHTELMNQLIDLPSIRSSTSVKKELLWVLANLCECADRQQINRLIDLGGLTVLTNGLIDGGEGLSEVAGNAIIQLIYRYPNVVDHTMFQTLPIRIIQSINQLLMDQIEDCSNEHISDVLNGSNDRHELIWAEWVSQLSVAHINRLIALRNVFRLVNQSCEESDMNRVNPLHASEERTDD